MIEKMNERITFQHCDLTVDRYGNHANRWIDYFTCNAYACTYVRDETENVVPLDQRSIIFEVRYCSELANITSTEYRIVFRNIAYNIESVDMMNYRKKTIRFSCRKEARL